MTYSKLATFFGANIVVIYNGCSETSMLLLSNGTFPLKGESHCFELLCEEARKSGKFSEVDLIQFIITDVPDWMRSLYMNRFASEGAFSANLYPISIMDKTQSGQPESYNIQRSDGKIFNEKGELVEIISADDVLEHFAEDLRRGNGKIAAIKRYREVFGVGLKEAKDAVESWALGRHGTVKTVEEVLSPFKNQILAKSNQARIDAIKKYREEFCVGLREANDAVNVWIASLSE